MIYILEFSHPLGNHKHQARYYLGSCRDDLLQERIQTHRDGRGAAITRAAVERGYRLELVGTLPGGRDEEKRLKRWKKTSQIAEIIRRKAEATP